MNYCAIVMHISNTTSAKQSPFLLVIYLLSVFLIDKIDHFQENDHQCQQPVYKNTIITILIHDPRIPLVMELFKSRSKEVTE